LFGAKENATIGIGGPVSIACGNAEDEGGDIFNIELNGMTMNLTQRIERLERQNKTLRSICGVTVIALVCLVAMGATFLNQVVQHEVVRAKKFVLLDGTNREVGEITTNADGPFMAVHQNGISSLIGINRGTPHLTLDKPGRPTKAYDLP
jgi:hypothetical protein